MLIYTKKYYFLSLMIMILSVSTASGQQYVYAGDTDNNGVVNYLDVLNVSYAYGSTGAARAIVVDSPQANVSLAQFPWDDQFPGGLNYTFADANGDGVIDWEDILVVYSNYGQVNENGTNEVFVNGGVEGQHISLSFEEEIVRVTGGSEIELNLLFGNEDFVLNDLTSLGFSIKAETPFISDIGFSFAEVENNWILENNNGLTFVSPPSDFTKVDVAMAQFGSTSVEGSGIIGKATAVIEEDIIALLPADADSVDVIISIDEVAAKNSDFWNYPVVNDTLIIRVVHPDAFLVTSTSSTPTPKEEINISPNPFSESLTIQAEYPIEYINIYSPQGDVIYHQQCNAKETVINADKLKGTGIYFCEIQTNKRVVVKKILHTTNN